MMAKAVSSPLILAGSDVWSETLRPTYAVLRQLPALRRPVRLWHLLVRWCSQSEVCSLRQATKRCTNEIAKMSSASNSKHEGAQMKKMIMRYHGSLE